MATRQNKCLIVKKSKPGIRGAVYWVRGPYGSFKVKKHRGEWAHFEVRRGKLEKLIGTWPNLTLAKGAARFAAGCSRKSG